jgi:hypothetical protein
MMPVPTPTPFVKITEAMIPSPFEKMTRHEYGVAREEGRRLAPLVAIFYPDGQLELLLATSTWDCRLDLEPGVPQGAFLYDGMTTFYDRFGTYAHAPGHEEHDVPEGNYRVRPYLEWALESIAEIARFSRQHP